jgi:hypothetical protein
VIVDRLPRPGVVLCWEPHGLWDTGELTSTARALGLLPVIDATRDPLPLGPMAYTRIRALGAAQAVSARALDRLAEQLKGRREAWVVVEDRTSCQRIKAQLGQAMDRLGPTSAPIVVRPSPGKMRAEDEEQ